jgi:DNA-binding HxlR family transcriptional regulator
MQFEMKFRSNCPISSALDLLGDKWSLLIVRDLIFLKKSTFKELSTSKEKIASNILSNRLLKLERSGVINKSLHPTNKKVRLYTVTDEGISLLTVILELGLWYIEHHNYDDHPIPIEYILAIKAYQQDKEGYIKDFIKTWKS